MWQVYFLTTGKPKDKGVALAGGYYYPYLRNENSETFSVLKRCKSESEAQKVLKKGTAYDIYANAIRKEFDKSSQRLQSGTNVNGSGNGGIGYGKESSVVNGVDFETEKEKRNFTNT